MVKDCHHSLTPSRPILTGEISCMKTSVEPAPAPAYPVGSHLHSHLTRRATTRAAITSIRNTPKEGTQIQYSRGFFRYASNLSYHAVFSNTEEAKGA